MERKDPRQVHSIKKIQESYLSLLLKENEKNISIQLKQALTINSPKTVHELRSDDLPENLIRLFEHILQNQLAYEVLMIYKPDELFNQEVKNILRHFVDEGIRLSKIADGGLRVDLSFLISYTTGAYFESIIWWIKTNYQFSPQQMTATLYEIAFHGPYKFE